MPLQFSALMAERIQLRTTYRSAASDVAEAAATLRARFGRCAREMINLMVSRHHSRALEKRLRRRGVKPRHQVARQMLKDFQLLDPYAARTPCPAPKSGACRFS
jgi:hypothetical protein